MLFWKREFLTFHFIGHLVAMEGLKVKVALRETLHLLDFFSELVLTPDLQVADVVECVHPIKRFAVLSQVALLPLVGIAACPTIGVKGV